MATKYEEQLMPDEKSEIFERLFDHAPDAVVVIDGNGMIRKASRQVEAIFGYRPDELIGRNVEILVPDRFRNRHRQHLAGYFTNPHTRKMGAGLEFFGRTRDGSELPVDIMLSPIETDQGMWACAVIRDVTERKQYEAMITALNEALKSQLEELAAANRELEAFSYSVSHDLRAPLRHIGGFLQLLNEKDLGCLDEEGRHYLKVIALSAAKMGTLIDDLLDFSRMGRVEMMKGAVDVGELVRDLIAELAQETKEREIDWVVAPLPVVMGDRAMLRQVLANLIANAVKFTRPRPRARIEIGVTTNHPDETRLYVRDNGVGFDMQYVNKAFGLFQRLHGAEQFEGTGVGLANVQRIVLRHGGRTWAEGAVDGGATFWISLPKNAE